MVTVTELEALFNERRLLLRVTDWLEKGADFTVTMRDPTSKSAAYLEFPAGYARDAILQRIAERARWLGVAFAQYGIDDAPEPPEAPAPAPVPPAPPAPAGGASAAVDEATAREAVYTTEIRQKPNVESTLIEGEDAHGAGHGPL